jgi:hypothetical protein
MIKTETPVYVRSLYSSSSRLLTIIMEKKLLYTIGAFFLLVITTTVVLLFTVGPLASKTTDDPACAVIDTQKDALLALKAGLIGADSNGLADWYFGTDPCADGWGGIICDDSCNVTKINVGK